MEYRQVNLNTPYKLLLQNEHVISGTVTLNDLDGDIFYEVRGKKYDGSPAVILVHPDFVEEWHQTTDEELDKEIAERHARKAKKENTFSFSECIKKSLTEIEATLKPTVEAASFDNQATRINVNETLQNMPIEDLNEVFGRIDKVGDALGINLGEGRRISLFRSEEASLCISSILFKILGVDPKGEVAIEGLVADDASHVEDMPARTCYICGCTDKNACLTDVTTEDDSGTCHWVASNLCSACQEKHKQEVAKLEGKRFLSLEQAQAEHELVTFRVSGGISPDQCCVLDNDHDGNCPVHPEAKTIYAEVPKDVDEEISKGQTKVDYDEKERDSYVEELP
jgi:hypothetical protein